MNVSKLKLPVDILLEKSFRNHLNVCKFVKFHKFLPFSSFVTLDLVRDEEVRRAAQDYISKLMLEKEQYGYLYFLNSKRLLIPLNLQFNADLAVDPENFDEIVAEIDTLARLFACPSNQIFEITRIELLYFMILLVNPKLTWIAVDHYVRGNRNHAYLIAAPNRLA